MLTPGALTLEFQDILLCYDFAAVSYKVDNSHTSSQYTRKALPMGLVQRVLRRQQTRIYKLFEQAVDPQPHHRVLDLGVNGALTRPYHHFFEWHYPFRSQIVAAGLEAPDQFEACFPEIHYVRLRRDGRLPFRDLEFDVVFCSAVVEHVGTRSTQIEFLREVARVSKSAFITTPNRWYPVELHTMLPLVHYLPTPWYRSVLRSLGFEFFSREENLNLLDRKSLRAIIPVGVDFTIRPARFFGLTSNLLLHWSRRTLDVNE